ncbi:dihydroneopterin aldolase [Paracoccus pacificus]|uniref:dihydroneopterin aldolase n=1 Tax=Paracoccus pacificus TaxID=1463598 RepID=A0ABW4R2B6_9RHOB
MSEPLSEPALPPDRIHLRDHVVTAEIGAFQTERGVGQRLRFDILVELAQGVQDVGDDVDRILSYDRLVEAVATALADERLNLVETLAERIAAQILAHPQAACVTVTVEKLDRAPGALGVTITRRTPRVQAVAAGQPQPVVLVIGRGNGGRGNGGPGNGGAGAGGPVIVVPAAATAGPFVTDPGAARRIALIALDQAAWALAADIPGALVADSRTELDWAVTEGRTAVWAPARMTADTDVPADPAELAFWLAARMNAARVEFALASGDDPPPPPAGFAIPVTRRKV